MRDFSYRNPRFHSSAELALHVGDTTTEGVCLDLSQEGVLATFDHGQQEVGTEGWILLRYSDRQFTLGVMVTHREEKQVGLSFLRRTRQEKAAAEQFAAYLGLQKKQALVRRPG